MSQRAASIAEEAGWLARIALGDEAAFVLFYRRFSAPVFSMLIKMLGNQHDAEEVLQLSFLQICLPERTSVPRDVQHHAVAEIEAYVDV